MNISLLAQLQDDLGRSGMALLFLLLQLVLAPVWPAGKPWLWRLIENAGVGLDRRLNRSNRTPRELFIRGVLATGFMGLFALVFGMTVDHIAQFDYGWLMTLLFMSTTISPVGALNLLRRVAKTMRGKEIKTAIKMIEPVAGEDLSRADIHRATRRAIEFAAVSLNAHYIAPLFWYVVGGTPMLAAYVMFAALYEAYGMNDARHWMFSGLVRWIERALDLIPIRVTAAFIVLGALFVSRSNPWRGAKIAFGQARHYSPRNRGWVVAAMAGGMGITLGGPIVPRGGVADQRVWLGAKDSSAQTTVNDLSRATVLFFVVFLLGFITLAGIMLATEYYT